MIFIPSFLVCTGPTVPPKPSESALATAILYCFQEYGTAAERPWVIQDSTLDKEKDRYLKSILVPKGIWFAGNSFEDRERRTERYCYLAVSKFSSLSLGRYKVSCAILNATSDPIVQQEVYPTVIAKRYHGKWLIDLKRSTVRYGGE